MIQHPFQFIKNIPCSHKLQSFKALDIGLDIRASGRSHMGYKITFVLPILTILIELWEKCVLDVNSEQHVRVLQIIRQAAYTEKMDKRLKKCLIR